MSYMRSQKMLICYCVAIVFLSVSLTSCVQVRMHEVGPDNPHYSYIGRTIRLKEDAWLLGISLKNRPPVEYYILEGGVGFGGREVVVTDRMRQGSTLTITKVLANDSTFFPRMRYVARVLDGGSHLGKEVQIRLVYNKADKGFALNRDYFEIID